MAGASDLSLLRYQAYRDSGVAWLGEIPGHWTETRLRFIAQINPAKSEVSGLPGDTLITFLPMEAIGEQGKAGVATGCHHGDGEVPSASISIYRSRSALSGPVSITHDR